MKNKIFASVASVLLTSILLAPFANAQSRDLITVVGSSTVYPFTTTVAEQFGRGGKFKSPKVESTGTGGGIKLFCNGVGPQYPDAVNASRPMKKTEYDICVKNGVNDIVEIKIGFDGIIIAEGKKTARLSGITKKQIYLALAKQVPDASGNMIANPYKTWNQIDPSLPNQKIEVLGPPPTSGTRDSFLELFMEPGCGKEDKKLCTTIREDGVYIEAGENDNLIVQKLLTNPNALGIFGFSFLDANQDKIKGLALDGINPTYETISSTKYTAARPLFVYFKKQHYAAIPGLKEFVQEFVSDKAIGEEGYLIDRGLVALGKSQLNQTRKDSSKKFVP